MGKNTQIKKTMLSLLADKSILPVSKECTRVVEITISAPMVKEPKEQPPLNLSLVVDRSGSMAGEKLHHAKQAASHLVDLLTEKDHLAVVMYDDRIDIVSVSRPMNEENKALIKSEIQGITSRGSTNLFDGWVRGCRQITEHSAENTFNRTLLLSDGLANQGKTDTDEIATHVSKLFERKISTSCFGIGLDYNEQLLEAMSNAGGGNFHFLEAMSAIPAALEREFKELMHATLTEADIRLTLPIGVTCNLSAGWPHTQNGQVFLTNLGNLHSGRLVKIYFQLNFPAITEDKPITIPVSLTAKTVEGKAIELEKTLTLSIVNASVEMETAQDAELMKRFALVDMADQATEAMRLARAGRRAEASQMLGQRMRRHRNSLPADSIRKYEHMDKEINNGMSKYAFKRHHQEEYFNKRTRADVRDYRLELVKRHLITTIENRRVLIDSGIPVSLGRENEWYFLQEVHTLSEEYLGVTLDTISMLVGAPIDIIMGSDILKNYCVLFELASRRITFGTQPLLRSPFKFPLTLLMGIPGFTVDIAGRSLEVFLDTGAKLSYVSSNLLKGLKPVGTEKDFYPGMGEFETKVYDMDFSLGDLSFTLRCGVLPHLLESSLFITGREGIIGTAFFEKYRVQLDIPRKTICIQ